MSDPTSLMAEPLLPPGLKIGGGRDLMNRPVVRCTLRLHGAAAELEIVLTPRQVEAVVPALANQEDRRVRAFAALLLRQAGLVGGGGGPPLRLVDDGAAEGRRR